jgi:hypothetical protein
MEKVAQNWATYYAILYIIAQQAKFAQSGHPDLGPRSENLICVNKDAGGLT